MTSDSSETSLTFGSSTKIAFVEYMNENPNNRRVSQTEKENIVEWLTNPGKRPSNQREFSRRNYVRKTFKWDEKEQCLLAVGKTNKDQSRVVVTEDKIVHVVERAHHENSHAGWDATWKAVSASYYGILRSDLIFLLKRCQICAQNPSKRPKGSVPSTASTYLVECETNESLGKEDIQNNGIDRDRDGKEVEHQPDLYGNVCEGFVSAEGLWSPMI